MILFASNDRNLTHQKLAEVLTLQNGDTPFPNAFCREDYNASEMYEVHHGLEPLTPAQQAQAEALALALK